MGKQTQYYIAVDGRQMCWGRGLTESEAQANCRKAGGRKIVMQTYYGSESGEKPYIDEIGNVCHWPLVK